jgi:glutathione S-transferase
MHQLYWSPNSGSLAPMAVLEALKEATGADYRAVKIDTKAGEHRTPEYLTKVHPLGTVPALRVDGAKTLLESAAITLYLADLCPNNIVAPAPSSPERGAYLDWMIYGATSIYTVYMRIYQAEQHTPEGVETDRISDLARATLKDRWRVIERTLSERRAGHWLVRDTATAADLYLAMLALWYPDQDELARLWPRVSALQAAAFAEPCMARANTIHLMG